jgi:hypothetical protein
VQPGTSAGDRTAPIDLEPVKQSGFSIEQIPPRGGQDERESCSEKVRFASGNTDCAAWHYPGTDSACVIMTGGMA